MEEVLPLTEERLKIIETKNEAFSDRGIAFVLAFSL